MTEPDRRRLPNRRRVETTSMTSPNDVQFEGSVGFDQSGRAREVFLAGTKAGSDTEAILSDAAVIMSIALQYGVPVEAWRRSIARKPAELDGPPVDPVSILGMIVDLVAEYSPGIGASSTLKRAMEYLEKGDT